MKMLKYYDFLITFQPVFTYGMQLYWNLAFTFDSAIGVEFLYILKLGFYFLIFFLLYKLCEVCVCM